MTMSYECTRNILDDKVMRVFLFMDGLKSFSLAR